MRNQTSDVAGVIFGLLLLVGLSQTYAPPLLGFDTADNPFVSFSSYDPSTGAMTCTTGTSCNVYDYDGIITSSPGAGATNGDCAFNINVGDTDGDGLVTMGYSILFGGVVDGGCIVLEDWDQDGICDHRVYDHTQNQGFTDYTPSDYYHVNLGAGLWGRMIGIGVCTGWVGV